MSPSSALLTYFGIHNTPRKAELGNKRQMTYFPPCTSSVIVYDCTVMPLLC